MRGFFTLRPQFSFKFLQLLRYIVNNLLELVIRAKIRKLQLNTDILIKSGILIHAHLSFQYLSKNRRNLQYQRFFTCIS